MTNTELMLEGLNLMFAGMGFVMLFLLLLIYAIDFSSKLINRYFPEPIAQPTDSPSKPAVVEDEMARLRPVIIAAIAHHRRQQGLK